MDQFNALSEDFTPYFVEYGIEVIGAITILIVGLITAKWLGNRTEPYLDRSKRFNKTVTPLFTKSVRILVIAVTILVVLNQFGIETASLIAVLGTIGLALQGTLSNIASGIMLLMLQPFNVGDTVDIGNTLGVVDEIGLFVTEMHTFDNIAITMPNSKIWGNEIRNYTHNNTRRVDMEFGIGYDDDMDKAMKIIKEILDADERVLPEPEALIAVASLGDNAVEILVRPWTETSNVWPLRFDITKKYQRTI